jgi:2,4-dienoyl-CoA reductase-like NADH-dependent reductase (Old Yellow Enzyme family)
MPSDRNALHYAKRARGGVGLVIVEATCVSPDGKLAPGQLGLWEDRQIEGHQRITDAVHVYDCPVMVQIHHAGLNSKTAEPVTASDYRQERNGKTVSARGMTKAEVEDCIGRFVSAAKRACLAGYDGVELHGAHSYLISQFLCADVNRRTDEYGGSVENRARIATQIIRAIRRECGEDFVIGIRIGFNEPDPKTSGEIIGLLEAAGLDLCNISTGFSSAFSDPPADYPYSKRVYGASLLRPYVHVPTICVGQVRDMKTAEAILDAGIADCVAIGRGLLADEELVYKSKQGSESGVLTCVECPRCFYYTDFENCPGQRAKNKQA